MLFSDPIYFLIFLPINVFLFYGIGRFNRSLALISLIVCSLFFYAYWHPKYIFILLGSILFNYLTAKIITHLKKRYILYIGIAFNIILLGYFKYTNFIIGNINSLTGTGFYVDKILLPIGISFFTFQQIAYLVDTHNKKVLDDSFLSYVLFICFFPQLIAGPIVHHTDVVSQYNDRRIFKKDYKHIYIAIFLFSIGLFKKVVIADHFSVIVDAGYSNSEIISQVNAWITVLSYTFQIYFDFSGYTDMALASALFFNIRLPINFNSPYKALNIQDFWRRWHITLSRWLGQYIYIPLGGNRKGFKKMLINIMIVFIIGGIWHGASWTFVLWGLSHGAAISVYHIFDKLNINVKKPIAWFITFIFIIFSWVLFRASNIEQALEIYKALLFSNWNGVAIEQLIKIIIIIVTFIVVFQKNSTTLVNELLAGKKSKVTTFYMVLMFVVATYFSLVSTNEIFLYFNF